ncbi:MAG: YfhO family protein [Candidatus Gottesmanbacteria bacterium]|nr:YfhO family protein [Candidatus Gottesmanbacteria bacterium]
MRRKSFHAWVGEVFAVAALLFVVTVFFSPVFFEGKLPVPSDTLVGLYHPWRDLYSDTNPRGVPFKNFLITDPVRQQIPWRKIAIDQWKQGEIPLWNPYNFSGAPILTNIQAAALYPLNILFLVFPFIDAWAMLIMLQPLLAGLFMYWYLRSLALRSIASLLGAIAWSFSGFNVAWFTWGTIGHVALWLPLALLSIDRMLLAGMSFPSRQRRGKLQRESIFWSMVFIVSLVFQFFAGHAQISLYFILVVIAYGVMRIFQAKEQKKSVFVFIFLLSLVAILTAVQWIPFLDWTQQSSRVFDSAAWNKEGWLIPWAHLVQFVAPDFFGNPTTLNYWGQWNYGEFVGYIGILPLVFAFIAIFSPSFKKHRFWIWISAAALLFALPTPISALPFILKVPILSSLQPTRLLFIVDFALAVLAAYGCHEFLENTKRRRWIWSLCSLGGILAILWVVSISGSLQVSMRNLVLPTVLFIVAAALFILYHRLHRIVSLRNILAWSFVGLVAVDLLRFGWKFTPFTPREYFFPETKILSFLKQQPRPFRIMSVDKRILPPNTASYFGIESIEGYDPIIGSRYEEFMAAIARGKPDVSPPFGFNRIITLASLHSSLLPIVNVKYILSLTDLSEPFLKKVFVEGETRVYEDSRLFPRVWAVEKTIRTSGKEETIKALYAVKDVRREAVVEGDVSVLSVPMRSEEYVSLKTYQSNRLNIDTSFSVPRLLVVSNTYHPGWRAAIDGKKTQIYRTNYAFQGIVVPAGTHTVLFSYAL